MCCLPALAASRSMLAGGMTLISCMTQGTPVPANCSRLPQRVRPLLLTFELWVLCFAMESMYRPPPLLAQPGNEALSFYRAGAGTSAAASAANAGSSAAAATAAGAAAGARLLDFEIASVSTYPYIWC